MRWGERSGSGSRRPDSRESEGIHGSAEIGKISVLEARLGEFRWTLCSGYTWDVLVMWVWDGMEDGWWDVSGTAFCGCLWDLCRF